MTAFAEGHHVGPYRIVRLLGAGGMGAVYEARQEPLERRVAIKTLHPEYASNREAVARFFNEAKILSRLEHPSIVQVSDFGETPDGTNYLVMEYLRGHSLAHRLRELGAHGQRIPVLTAVQLAFQVADVLAVAHAQGIIHRDIKPDNLMLVADPVAPGGERVKVLDFGIAKLTKASDKGSVKTDTQAVIGTPQYMSPEQCAGAGGVTARTDVYSLGCVLFEALAGRPPFVAEGAGQLIGMHLFQTPPPLLSVAPKVPAQLAELVHLLLTRDQALRPSMSDAADSLGSLVSKLSGSGSVVRSMTVSDTDPDSTRPAPRLMPSTTLGRAAGQSQLGQLSPQWRRAGLVVGGVIGLLIASIWFVRPRAKAPVVVLPPTSSTSQKSPDMVSPVVSPRPEPRSVTWHIDSEPNGAAVVDEEAHLLGKTPLTTSRRAETGQITLQLRRRGYTDVTIRLDRAHDVEQRFVLTPLPAPTRRDPVKPRPAAQPLPEPAKPAGKKRIGYEQ